MEFASLINRQKVTVADWARASCSASGDLAAVREWVYLDAGVGLRLILQIFFRRMIVEWSLNIRITYRAFMRQNAKKERMDRCCTVFFSDNYSALCSVLSCAVYSVRKSDLMFAPSTQQPAGRRSEWNPIHWWDDVCCFARPLEKIFRFPWGKKVLNFNKTATCQTGTCCVLSSTFPWVRINAVICTFYTDRWCEISILR